MITVGRKILRSQRGQAIVELALILPLLLLLAFGTIEFSNMLDVNLALTHLTREGANLTSRDRTLTEAEIQTYLTTVIDAAKPTLCRDGAGCVQNDTRWTVIYSQIEYDTTMGQCGTLTNNQPDFYRIKRQGTWTKGGLSQASKIGDHNDCAKDQLPSILGMAESRSFHVVEAFYDYAPGTLTPVENFLGFVLPDIFYDRTIFTEV
jgi:hypothetical protein